MLLACRDVVEDAHDLKGLESVISALADLEDELGHIDDAVRLEQDALRISYMADDPRDVAVSHFNLANYLQKADVEPAVALGHRLACAVLEFQMGVGRLDVTLRQLARDLASFEQDPPLPTSFAELCALVERASGVRFGELVERLPRRALDGDAALAEVLRLTRQLPPDEAFDLQRHFAWWDPVLAGIVAAAGGNPQAAQVVEQTLTERGERADWRALAGVLGRILAGDRDSALTQGLDQIDTAIVQRALDALAGRVQLDPDSWQTLTGPALPDELAQLAAAVVAAAKGDQDAAVALEPLLTDLAGEQDWAALAGVLRRILVGDRDPALTQGLDETDTAVVTTILDQLSSQPSTTRP